MMNLGLHVIQFPSKRFGFVGHIPGELGVAVKPTKEDIMAQRTHYDREGNVWTMKFPSFETRDEAVAHIMKFFPTAVDNDTKGFAI